MNEDRVLLQRRNIIVAGGILLSQWAISCLGAGAKMGQVKRGPVKDLPKQANTKYKVVSLFSGAMGLDIGLENTDRFLVVACVEIEKAFCDTIRANQRAGRLSPNLRVFEADIRDLDPHEVLRTIGLAPGEVDLLVGGPPCQSFSTAGRRRTTQDPRGTLLWQFLQFVE